MRAENQRVASPLTASTIASAAIPPASPTTVAAATAASPRATIVSTTRPARIGVSTPTTDETTVNSRKAARPRRYGAAKRQMRGTVPLLIERGASTPWVTLRSIPNGLSTRSPSDGGANARLSGRTSPLSLLLLRAGGPAPAPQRDSRLREDAVHEPVGAARRLGEGPDAGPLLVLLLEVGRELVALGAGDARALLQIGHSPGPLQLVVPGPSRCGPGPAMIVHPTGPGTGDLFEDR